MSNKTKEKSTKKFQYGNRKPETGSGVNAYFVCYRVSTNLNIPYARIHSSFFGHSNWFGRIAKTVMATTRGTNQDPKLCKVIILLQLEIVRNLTMFERHQSLSGLEQILKISFYTHKKKGFKKVFLYDRDSCTVWRRLVDCSVLYCILQNLKHFLRGKQVI